MFERLKKLFSPSRRPEVEYRQPSRDERAAVPANPPTSGIAPAAPVDRPADDSEQR